MTKLIKKSVAIAKTPALDMGLIVASTGLLLGAMLLTLMG